MNRNDQAAAQLGYHFVVVYLRFPKLFFVTLLFQLQLEDSRVAIATIASSRYVGPIKNKVLEWQRQLDIMHDTLVSS